MPRCRSPRGARATAAVLVMWICALGPALLVGGCVTEPRPDPPWVTRVHKSGVIGGVALDPSLDEVENPPKRDAPEPGETIRIGAEATAALDGYFAVRRTLIGDVTVVDLSRTPFLGMTVFSISKDDVERVDSVDQEAGALVVTLRNRTGVRTVLNALPRAQIGETLVIGTDQLVLRFHGRTDRARPIHFRAVANGRAVIRTEDPPERSRGRRVTIRADVVGLEEASRFVSDVQVDP